VFGSSGIAVADRAAAGDGGKSQHFVVAVPNHLGMSLKSFHPATVPQIEAAAATTLSCQANWTSYLLCILVFLFPW
jgi:hypothetical protein